MNAIIHCLFIFTLYFIFPTFLFADIRYSKSLNSLKSLIRLNRINEFSKEMPLQINYLNDPEDTDLILNHKIELMINLLLKPGNAPYCEDSLRHILYASKNDQDRLCDDGDSTLYNGLLCSANINAGCEAVRSSQIIATGEWLRSPRLVSDRNLRTTNSFSPDMALGLQIYAVTKNKTEVSQDISKWLQWIEDNRPCLIGVEPNCIRGLPRFCKDDDEGGCTIRPTDYFILANTIHFLEIKIPQSLAKILANTVSTNLNDSWIINTAQMNELGYSLHLVGVTIWLYKLEGRANPYLQKAAEILNHRQPLNPFFMFLAHGPTLEVKKRLLEICPTRQDMIPKNRTQWSWERDDAEHAWSQSMLWDCVFMGKIILNTNKPTKIFKDL